MHRVVITDHKFASIDEERSILGAAGAELSVASSPEGEALVSEIREADALLVQWARLDEPLLERLDRCRVIVRYGIGTDNIDLAAAKRRGIAVCNVPDYGIDEVADHAVALAVSIGRQLRQLDGRVRSGVWTMKPPAPMPAFRDMVFATAGFGRIARAALERARGFKFKLAAYDPYLPASAFEEAGVARLGLDELFERADALSLHLPLTAQTRNFVSRERLARMKRTALLVNTARGPLVDGEALAEALSRGVIAGAGLDVFDPEPLPSGHPLLGAPNLILSPHVAWFSERSVPTLQRKAAEEIVRGLRGEPLRSRLA